MISLGKKLEIRLSKAEVDAVVSELIKDSKNKRELIDLLHSDNQVVLFNAFWIVSTLALKRPTILKCWEAVIFLAAMKHKENESVIRCCLSAFKIIAIPEQIEDELYSFSIARIESRNSPVAHRAFALMVAYRISKKYPELKSEVLELAKINLETYGTESAGVASSARKVIKLLGG